MNIFRRQKIKSIISALYMNDNISILSIQQIQKRIENVLDEEQDAFDNLSEGLQYTKNGQKMEESIDYLEECLEIIDDILIELQKETIKQDNELINDMIFDLVDILEDIII